METVSAKAKTKRTEHKDKAEQIKLQITALVREIEDTFLLGIPFRNLSQKFNKTADKYGYSLRTLIKELDKEGKVFTYLNENGALLVLAPEVREQFECDDFGMPTEETKAMIAARWKK